MKKDNENREGQKLTLKKKAMLKALKENRGFVSIAANAVGIRRETHYDWLKTDPEYKRIYEEVLELDLDQVENKLRDRIDANDTTAVIFHLKTKGRKRGYYEQDIVEQKEEVKHDLSKLSNDELKKFMELMQKVQPE